MLDRSKGGIADRTNEGEIGGLLTIGYFMKSKRESRTSELQSLAAWQEYLIRFPLDILLPV